MGEFSGKRVAVTGGALGIGQGIVEAFAGQGAKVVFADIHEEAGRETEQALRKLTQQVWFIRADLSMEQQVEHFICEALDRLGQVDVLINNVGVNFKHGNILAHAVTDFEKSLQLNLLSSIRCIRAFLPSMLESGKGAIVNISSTMALGAKGFSAYSVSKSSLVALTQSLALDHAADGVRINAVAPGAIRTPATQPWIDSINDPAMDKGIPMKRLGTAREVAEAVLFLASERASYITGQVLTVDGGLTVGE